MNKTKSLLPPSNKLSDDVWS